MNDKFVKSFLVKSKIDGKQYCCKHFDVLQVVNRINLKYENESTYYAVNIGAGDGKSMNDPVYPFYTNGYGGLAIDAEINKELFNNLPQKNIIKIDNILVTPCNIIDLLRSNNCPILCDFLKIDIDGYDGAILKLILEYGFKPKVMQIEINPEIPPPISFCVLYDDAYKCQDKNGNFGGFYGLSLGYILEICNNFDYQIIQLDFVTKWTHDVTLLHKKYLSLFSEQERTIFSKTGREMFLSHPPGYSHFKEYGINTLPWRYETDIYKLTKMIWNSCIIANQKKHNGYCVPFYFSS